jgi:hypothetical protein
LTKRLTNAIAPMIKVTIQPFTRSFGIATRKRSMVVGGLIGRSGRTRGGGDPGVTAAAGPTDPASASRTWCVTRPS